MTEQLAESVVKREALEINFIELEIGKHSIDVDSGEANIEYNIELYWYIKEMQFDRDTPPEIIERYATSCQVDVEFTNDDVSYKFDISDFVRDNCLIE